MATSPQRTDWTILRRNLEKQRLLKKRLFKRAGINIDTLSKLAAIFFRSTPVYARGHRNAAYPRVVRKTFFLADLPKAFDGYRILHLTDLHLDSIPALAGRAAAKIRRFFKETSIDACVLTGDYVDVHALKQFDTILSPMGQLCSAMAPKDGIFAVLGNHDTWKMVAPFEAMGIRMLINETCLVRRGDTTLAFTGVDDPNDYFTPDALKALEKVDAGFKIALIHTPELYKAAEKNGFNLYLTGHTHGGQISLPGGWPVVLPLKKGRQFYKGVWQYKKMTGYTNQGLGTVSIPIRFNTFSEITLIELRKAKKNGAVR